MRRCYFVLLLLIPLSSNAQKIRFTDPTNFWRVEETYIFASSSPQFFYYDFWYGMDTTIGSTVYKKMLCSDSSRGYVREDTAAGLVFYYNTTNSSEDTLYNYNFISDDTIAYQVGSYNIIDGRDPYFDSTLINGVSYKRFDYLCANCNAYAFYRDYTTIEGIGCLSGPLFPTSLGACMNGVAYISFDLSCFSQNNIAPSFSIHPIADCNGTHSVTNAGTCGPTGVNNLQFAGSSLRVYPNPVIDELVLECGSQVGTISICNMQGQVVYRGMAVQGKNIIAMGGFAQGVYFVELHRADGIKEVKKIVRQ